MARNLRVCSTCKLDTHTTVPNAKLGGTYFPVILTACYQYSYIVECSIRKLKFERDVRPGQTEDIKMGVNYCVS